jgi:hypothetical protein
MTQAIAHVNSTSAAEPVTGGGKGVAAVIHDISGASMPTPILDDIENALGVPAMLRLALNTLRDEMPVEWAIGNVREVLNALRDKIEELELQQIRQLGHHEYLLIKPLAPDAGGTFAEKAAEHVRALDDLGLVVRLGL